MDIYFFSNEYRVELLLVLPLYHHHQKGPYSLWDFLKRMCVTRSLLQTAMKKPPSIDY
jgi:hypothetical protein